MPSDESVENRIEALEAERERLRQRESGPDLTLDEDVTRLEEIRVDLDLLWDLLRQRRALRDAGQDPNQTSERSPETVERYWQ